MSEPIAVFLALSWSRGSFAGDEGTVWQDKSGGAVAWVNEDNETGDHRPRVDVAYIAAANPSVILALLDELEALRGSTE